MNLRLASNSLRFKIDREELQQLLAGKTLENYILFAERNLYFLIVPVEADSAMSADYTGERIILKVGALRLRELAEKGRSKEGVEEETGDITISLQVDIRSKKPA